MVFHCMELSSTTNNLESIPLASKFSICSTALQVCYLYITCSAIFHCLKLSTFISTMSYKVGPASGPACSAGESLACAISQLLGPTCPLLDDSLSIIGDTIDDADISSSIILMLLHLRHHPQLVLPWVEVGLCSTSSIGRH